MDEPIKIMIFEDDLDMREGLVWFLCNQEQFSCVGAYPNANDIEQIIKNNTPDIVLMDIQMPGISGIDALKIIKKLSPELPVLILTTFQDEDNIFQAIRNGALGYLLKSNALTDLARSIQEILMGGSPINPQVARKMMAYFQKTLPLKPIEYYLTPREKEILTKLTEGDSVKMIAKSLFLSELTVGNHIRHIYKKLQVHSRGEAVSKALKEGIV